jgi:hypothetical protein
MLMKLDDANSFRPDPPDGRQRLFPRYWWATGVMAIVLVVAGGLLLQTPLGVAMWSLAVGLILSLAATDDDAMRSSVRVDLVAFGAAVPVLVLQLFFAGLSWPSAFMSAVVVYVLVNAVSGAMRGLVMCRIPDHVARGVMLIVGMVWLAWPMVFANVLVGESWETTVDWLVSLSPPFVLNMLLEPGDPWSHRPLAYRLMRLGQDVNFAMPTTSLWCIAIHLPLLVFNWFMAMRGASTFFAKRGIIDPM